MSSLRLQFPRLVVVIPHWSAKILDVFGHPSPGEGTWILFARQEQQRRMDTLCGCWNDLMQTEPKPFLSCRLATLSLGLAYSDKSQWLPC
eukprot:3534499-Rhodomonas_salina.1